MNYIHRWPEGWEKRSYPYRQGFQAAHDQRTTGIKPLCPYRPGMMEFDCWFAGLEHGKLATNMHQR